MWACRRASLPVAVSQDWCPLLLGVPLHSFLARPVSPQNPSGSLDLTALLSGLVRFPGPVLTSDQIPRLGEGGGTRALHWPWGKACGGQMLRARHSVQSTWAQTVALGEPLGLHFCLCELVGSGRARPTPRWMTRVGGHQVRGQRPGLLSLMTVATGTELLWRLGCPPGLAHPPTPDGSPGPAHLQPEGPPGPEPAANACASFEAPFKCVFSTPPATRAARPA